MEDTIKFFTNKINLAKNSFELLEEFERCMGLLHEQDIHNTFFERIYHLRNSSWDFEEIKQLDELRDLIESKVFELFEVYSDRRELLSLIKDVQKWFWVPGRDSNIIQ